ncbi:MAG: hypothetical protein KBD21_03330 [Candidatus Pacebacteria bacterium]|nr:hypothetical protein [Candidatus Paceibacterota bacterium]
MNKRTCSIFLVTLLTICTPLLVQGIEYIPLSPNLPLIGRDEWGDLGGLFNKFLAISVAVAALLAVIMVAIGGFKWMTTDSVFNMGDAKEQISNAIIGLLIVLASVLIMVTINPDIIKFNLFKLN